MNRSEDHIRALLDDAVSDVEPRRGLDSIRSRTVTARTRRTWAWSAGGAVLATAATVAAVAALSNGPGAPAPAPAPSGQSAASGPSRDVYFVGRSGGGLRLFPEVQRAASRAGALDEALTDAVAGTTQDPDYVSPWPSGTTVQRAQLNDGVLSVDLSGPVARRPSGVTAAQASLAVQQLVYTAQSASGTRLPVTFLLDGRPTATLLGEPTSRPVPAASADDTLAQVSVTAPAEGASVSSPFTVTGRASAFEANVQWELERPGGTVVKRGFATAAECCTLSPYSFSVTAPPGAYTLVVHDEDVSDGEGRAASQDTKRVTVR